MAKAGRTTPVELLYAYVCSQRGRSTSPELRIRLLEVASVGSGARLITTVEDMHAVRVAMERSDKKRRVPR